MLSDISGDWGGDQSHGYDDGRCDDDCEGRPPR